jgi:integrase
MRTGARAVDLELNTLKNVFKFAVRSGQLRANPLDLRRPSYCDSRTVKHCREYAPRSAEELHAHAAYFFSRPGSEVYGWQLLFEAFTGCRTSEALALRMDAKEHEPGWVTDGVLWLARAKGGTNNWIKIHPALSDWLKSFTTWRTALPDKMGAGGWWFPRADGQKQSPETLSRVLGQSSAIVCPGENRTSHGLRSYYVTVRRSQGASDAQIAIELGHRSGPGLIVQVYGEARPVALGWLPKGKTAWAGL